MFYATDGDGGGKRRLRNSTPQAQEAEMRAIELVDQAGMLSLLPVPDSRLMPTGGAKRVFVVMDDGSLLELDVGDTVEMSDN